MNVLPSDFDLQHAALVNSLRDRGIDGCDALQTDAEFSAMLRDCYAQTGRPVAREEAA